MLKILIHFVVAILLIQGTSDLYSQTPMEDIFFGPTFKLSYHYPSSQWEYDFEKQVFTLEASTEKPHFIFVKELAPIMLDVMVEPTQGAAGIKIETDRGEIDLMVEETKVSWSGYNKEGALQLSTSDFPLTLRAIVGQDGTSLWIAPEAQSLRAVWTEPDALIGAKMGLCVLKKGSYTFYNARVTKLGKKDLDHGEFGAVSSRLETIEITTGSRKILYEANDHFEAPNWCGDGTIIFNQGGQLIQFSPEDFSVKEIPTGHLTALNNDHGIHPRTSQLVVSNDEAHAGSRIYLLPREGGKPTPVTKEGPSYWHGWSPDGRFLLYTGKRVGDRHFNIYAMDLVERIETQLTNNRYLDDGPEYSSDGRYIYFNSNRSGTMQIWRMESKGEKPVQITFDTFQDWFPHPSPDGRWLVFLSFPPEVPSADHPPGRLVMIRILDLYHPQNVPRVLTHLYGGQGTINVPSWSPDSQKIAFVSYTF